MAECSSILKIMVMDKNKTYVYISTIDQLKEGIRINNKSILSKNMASLTLTQIKRRKTLSKKRAEEYTLIQSALNTFLLFFLDGALEDLVFNTSEIGKPFLEKNPLYFNISHSKHMVAYSFAMSSVGIDIELERPISSSETLLKRLLSEETLSYMNGYSFFEVWTKVESFVKCLGVSLFSIKPTQRLDLNPIIYNETSYYHQFLENHFNCVASITREGELGEIVRL